MPSVKLRSCITRSSSAVATIWLTAPNDTQPRKGRLGVGSA